MSDPSFKTIIYKRNYKLYILIFTVPHGGRANMRFWTQLHQAFHENSEDWRSSLSCTKTSVPTSERTQFVSNRKNTFYFCIRKQSGLIVRMSPNTMQCDKMQSHLMSRQAGLKTFKASRTQLWLIGVVPKHSENRTVRLRWLRTEQD
jgi:hypothetical protein